MSATRLLAAPLPTATNYRSTTSFRYLVTVLIDGGIPRFAQLHTTLPTRARFEITQYEVQKGDTIFGIAEKFGTQTTNHLVGQLSIPWQMTRIGCSLGRSSIFCPSTACCMNGTPAMV